MSEETTKTIIRTIAQALSDATADLQRAGLNATDARRDAILLLSEILRRNRAYLITHADDFISHDSLQIFQTYIERRTNGEPLQYIVGHQEFFGLRFEVTPNVLIPRPETELLVEIALEILRDQETVTFCDVGTGSGCIAVATLHELTARKIKANAIALDVSIAALRVAARNATRHNLSTQIAFINSDVLSALDSSHAKFDLIISNPPYIAAGGLGSLQREVRDHEPRIALTPNPKDVEKQDDGLSIIRRLLTDAPAFLKPHGHLAFEIGFAQRTQVESLIEARVWQIIEVRADLQGIPRAFVLQCSVMRTTS
ncbi:MAG: peptide chain release factor N(5)-glutamine methyltransferase [Pyrinomonadaceae bacterium]